MLTKRILKTEQINLFPDGIFLFCYEMGKGLVKRNLGNLSISDYSFENVITTIEGLSKYEMIQKGLDRVLFVDGEIFESKLLTEVVNEELNAIPLGTYSSVVDTVVLEKKSRSRYFSVSTIESVKSVLNNVNFIADGKISITENIAVGSTVSNDMILINMSNYNYDLQNYTDIFEFKNGILKTKGIIDYETRLNYVLQIKISDKLDASKFWLDTINVDIINVPDTIYMNPSRILDINENSSVGTIIGDLTTLFTKEIGLNVSMTIMSFADKFSISGNNLVVNGVLDYEISSQYVLTVRLTNIANNTMVWDMDVTVNVNNIIENTTIDVNKIVFYSRKQSTYTWFNNLKFYDVSGIPYNITVVAVTKLVGNLMMDGQIIGTITNSSSWDNGGFYWINYVTDGSGVATKGLLNSVNQTITVTINTPLKISKISWSNATSNNIERHSFIECNVFRDNVVVATKIDNMKYNELNPSMFII